MSTTHENGIVRVQSNHSVGGTLVRLQETLLSKGVKLFAVVDHSGEAERGGLNMPPNIAVIEAVAAVASE